MSKFFKNPVVHGIAVFIVMALGIFIHSGSPLLTMTIGGFAAGVIAYLTGVLG